MRPDGPNERRKAKQEDLKREGRPRRSANKQEQQRQEEMSFGDVHRDGLGQRSRGGGKLDESMANNEFTSQANLARGNIQQLLSNINSVQRLSSAIGTGKDTHDLREKLHKVIEETKLLSQDTKGIIKDLTQIANGSYQGSGSGSQRHKIESRKLSDDFQKALQRFQEVVRTTLQKERESVARAKQAREADEEDEEREGLLERQTERSLQFMQDDQELQFTEALIFERQQGIKDIEKNVNDVNEIFRDLAILVSDQGHMLDDIESGIVNTAAHAESASEELKKAQANQKRARRTLFCLITVLVLVGALVILIVTKTI
mmetsp:Transcript_45001/g.141667  ORF Transcript_45001/g.141667 Transcript_45001/m.141667 type:complete len:317 (-) Transcript_45001:43-993(-)